MAQNKFEVYSNTQEIESTLNLLNEIEGENSLSQRNLAIRLGVALGLTNALIKRCVRKGLIKVKEAPAKRFAYYITPKGFQEKTLLTAQYLTQSLGFFRDVRSQYSAAAQHSKACGYSTVMLYGATELAEIAILSAMEADFEYAAVVDDKRNDSTFCGLNVINKYEALNGSCNDLAVIITSMDNPQGAYDTLASFLPDDRIIAPKMLRITRHAADAQKVSGAST